MPRLNPRSSVLWSVLLVVMLNAAGQVLFKTARAATPEAPVLSLFLQLETWGGFVVYGLSAFWWLWVLSRVQLSIAYPMLSLTFPIVVGLSALLFSESISPIRWIGVGVIALGVSLLART